MIYSENLSFNFDHFSKNRTSFDKNTNLSKKNRYLFLYWNDHFSNNIIDITTLKSIINKNFDFFREYDLFNIDYIILELINNAFLSLLEYYMLSKIELPDNDLEKSHVSLEIIKNRKYIYFIVNNYNKIHKKSVDKIENILASKKITEIESTFTNENYRSFTGKSGIGLFSSKELLRNSYNSVLDFTYSNELNLVSFHFKINLGKLKKN